MRDALKTLAVAAVFFLLLWLFGVTVTAIADSSVPTSMTNVLFRMSEVLGDALCKVFGL